MAKVQLEAILKLVDVQVNPQVFRKISQAMAGMPASLQQTGKALQGANQHAQGFNKTLSKTTSHLTQNEKVARLLLQRMAQFAILLPTFVTMNRAIQGSVKFLFEFDSALRDIVRTDVSGLSGRIEEIGDAALKTATDFGVLAQEVLGVVKVFVQAGLTIEQAQSRANLAILATQVSTLSSADAVEFFIAASEQFQLSTEGLTNALDALVKVEDLAAVEAQDVAEAFRTGGNSFAEFAKDINAGIGLISALREQTRKSGREIGTFYKTLQTRIFAAGEARDAIEGLGVEVENLDGSLRPTLAVLTDLKKAFNGLTEAQTANAAKAIGGVRQFESLIAALNSVERANELTTQASQAAGTANQKRLVTDQKLEIQLGKLISQGQAFAEALGDAGLEDTIRGVLNVATGLLRVFTDIVDAVGKVGGNLTPLLALAGITLGKSIFGFSKNNAPGGGAGGFGGGGGGVGGNPLLAQANQQLKPVITSFGQQASLLTSATKNGVAAMSNYVRSITANTLGQSAATKQASQAQMQFAIEARNAMRLFKAQGGLGIGKAASTPTGSLLAGLLGTVVVPQIFDPLTKSSNEAGAAMAKTASTGLSLGLTFLSTGNLVAAAGAFLAGSLGSLASQAIDAYKVNQEAIKQNEATLDRNAGIAGGKKLFTGTSDLQDQFQKDFIDSLKKNIAQLGKEAGTQKTFEDAASSKEARGVGISTADQVRDAFFSTIDVQKKLIANQKEYIEGKSEESGRLKDLAILSAGIDGAKNADTGKTFSQLQDAIGATGSAAGSTAAEIIRASLALDEIGKIRESQKLAEGFRTLSLELELAKEGPLAVADSVVKMKNDILIAERELRSQGFDQQLSDIFSRLTPNGGDIKLATGELITANQLFVKISESLKQLDPQKVEEYNKFLENLPDAQRENADAITKILEDQAKAELSVQNQKNELQKEVSERAKKLLEEEQKAALGAFEATKLFAAELQKFGDAVSTDVLAQFQNVNIGDIEGVLSGNSGLSEGLQQMIQGAFGDNKGESRVAKAQTDLRAVSELSAAKLEILARKLEMVNEKLVDQANAADFASLTGEKLGIELDIEKTKQEAAIGAVEGKIKVLEAERQAAKDAAEAEKKRLDLLDKLAEASRDFGNELKEVQRSFEDFVKDKTADLIGKETDARQELKEAQQEVLDTTKELSDAYKSLIEAQYEFNGVMAEAKIKSNLLAKDIALLTGATFTFSGELSSLSDSYNEVLGQSNITLEKRIELERQLAEETLSFLQKARDEIVQAGVGVFGQTGAENQELGQGIAGLQFIAETLGGSFESFMNLTEGELASVTETLLALPADFRQQILDALSFLPSTTNIGGFNVDQLTQAIGQIGAGVAPEVGLPSIEELNTKQVEQLQRLQELALQDAQLQVSQIISAQEQVEAAKESAEAAKLLQERATESLGEVRESVLEEAAILEFANQQRQELTQAVIAADDRNTLTQIEKEAQLFAEQNDAFRDIGVEIVKGIGSLINSKLAVIGAAADVAEVTSKYSGYIPNFAGGNLTPGEAAGILRAAAKEKRMMPGGAGLAVANTSEAIIPMRHRGFIPNFADGNFDSIAAGIASVKQINASVVAAISQSITGALSSLGNDGSDNTDILGEIVSQLKSLNETTSEVRASNTAIQTNTGATESGGTQATARESVRIVLETNQNNSISVTGLSSLREELASAVKTAASEQVDTQLESLLAEFDSIVTALQERGILSSLGQIR